MECPDPGHQERPEPAGGRATPRARRPPPPLTPACALHRFPAHSTAPPCARAMAAPPHTPTHAPPLSRAACGTAHRPAVRTRARALPAGSCSFGAAGPASPVAALRCRGAEGRGGSGTATSGVEGAGSAVAGRQPGARGLGSALAPRQAPGEEAGQGQARWPVVRASSLEDAQEEGTPGTPRPRCRCRPPGKSIPHGPAQGALLTPITGSEEGPTPQGNRSPPPGEPRPRPPDEVLPPKGGPSGPGSPAPQLLAPALGSEPPVADASPVWEGKASDLE